MDDALNKRRLHQHWRKGLFVKDVPRKMMTRNETTEERLNDDVKTVKGFYCLRNELNASGGSEMTVIARTGVGGICSSSNLCYFDNDNFKGK